MIKMNFLKYCDNNSNNNNNSNNSNISNNILNNEIKNEEININSKEKKIIKKRKIEDDDNTFDFIRMKYFIDELSKEIIDQKHINQFVASELNIINNKIDNNSNNIDTNINNTNNNKNDNLEKKIDEMDLKIQKILNIVEEINRKDRTHIENLELENNNLKKDIEYLMKMNEENEYKEIKENNKKDNNSTYFY